ncbi:MAG: hypothetical protein ACLU4N_00805 [Butyricimonas faecihominis]
MISFIEYLTFACTKNKLCYKQHIQNITYTSSNRQELPRILTEKETWFIKVWESEQPEIYGLGECALFRGLI